VHLGEVEAQRHLGLAGQGVAQRRRADVGVAVAVAADPVAHAQEGRDAVAGQGALDVAVQARDLAQEGHWVVAQRVFDLVGHRQLGGAQHARLPQLRHTGADQRLVLGAPLGRGQGVALGHQRRHGALGIEDALALHLGGVGGEHRRDPGLLQHLGDVGGAVVGAVQALEAERQRARLLVTGGLVHGAAAQVVAVFGDVGQVAEVAEGADHRHRAVCREVLQQPVEHTAGRGVGLQAVGHRELPHPFDQLEGLQAFLLADHVAEQPAE
jgi:hypothetical protein